MENTRNGQTVTRLKQIRERAGYTQTTLGEALDVNPTSVLRWELGRTEPRLAQIRKLEAIFRQPVEALLAPERTAGGPKATRIHTNPENRTAKNSYRDSESYTS